MIVFFSPYPYESLRHDGMYRRIYEIDQLFKDNERIYIYHSPQGGDARIRPKFKVSENTYVQLLDLGFATHAYLLRDYIERCEFVYAQTMFYSSPYLSDFYSTGKVITDAHGAAYEETLLEGRLDRAKLVCLGEKVAVNESRAVVVVTQAMADYYRTKYHSNSTEFIYIPICHLDVKELPASIRKNKKNLKVIYAGGTQPWQNVPLMLKSIAQGKGKFETVILTRDVDYVRNLAVEFGALSFVTIASSKPNEVLEILKDCDFGFLLRDDHPVNNVAFPTKLIEYLAYGVIPIITTTKVGDYEKMGVEGISLDDFLANKIPTFDELEGIRERNFQRYRAIFDDYKHGVQRLKALTKEISSERITERDFRSLPSALRGACLPVCGCVVVNCSNGSTIQHSFELTVYPFSISLSLPAGTEIVSVLLRLNRCDAVINRPVIRLRKNGKLVYSDVFVQKNENYLDLTKGALKLVKAISLEVDRIEIDITALLLGKESYGYCNPQFKYLVLLNKAMSTIESDGLSAMLKKTYRYLKNAR